MAKLIYSAITSLDGYVEDRQCNFGWGAPDSEVLRFINDLERPISTYLYGRRIYETMAFWETAPAGSDQPAEMRDFAEIWRAAEKIVFSRTLQEPSSQRTGTAGSLHCRTAFVLSSSCWPSAASEAALCTSTTG
jgi:hypothetical protein